MCNYTSGQNSTSCLSAWLSPSPAHTILSFGASLPHSSTALLPQLLPDRVTADVHQMPLLYVPELAACHSSLLSPIRTDGNTISVGFSASTSSVSTNSMLCILPYLFLIPSQSKKKKTKKEVESQHMDSSPGFSWATFSVMFCPCRTLGCLCFYEMWFFWLLPGGPDGTANNPHHHHATTHAYTVHTQTALNPNCTHTRRNAYSNYQAHKEPQKSHSSPPAAPWPGALFQSQMAGQEWVGVGVWCFQLTWQ